MSKQVLLRCCALFVVLSVSFSAAAAAPLPQIATAGSFGAALLTGTTAFGSGNNDVLLAYLDKSGSGNWVRSWGRITDVYPADIWMDGSGEMVLVGSYPFLQQIEYVPVPAFVLKFDHNGTLLWEREINWADYSIRFHSVAEDTAGNIYATGLAWKYADTPEPEGWYASRGFIFTCKLSSSGELLWATRWSRDYSAFDAGRGVTVAGNNVAVLADYNAGGATGALMLFYSAADGATLVSDAIAGVTDELTILPAAIATNSSGMVLGACTAKRYLAGIEVESYAYLPCYSQDGSQLIQIGWTRGQDTFCVLYDIASAGREYILCGSHGVIPEPPNPESMSQPWHSPIILRFDGLFYRDNMYFADSSYKYTDYQYTSVCGTADGEVAVAGLAPFDSSATVQGTELYPGQGYFASLLPHVDAWEDKLCGAGSSPATASVLMSHPWSSVRDWALGQSLYSGLFVYADIPHIPFAVATADVLTGTAPLTVTFDASGSYIDIGSIDSYHWFVWGKSDDPDLPEQEGAIVSYTFEQPGVYYVAVQVTSDDGNTSQAYEMITVN